MKISTVGSGRGAEAEALKLARLGKPAMLDVAIGDHYTVEKKSIPAIGVVGWITTWIDRATRAQWATVEGIIGFVPGRSALRFVESA